MKLKLNDFIITGVLLGACLTTFLTTGCGRSQNNASGQTYEQQFPHYGQKLPAGATEWMKTHQNAAPLKGQ
jgi:hypothetical protein